MVSGVESSKIYLALIINVILLLVLLTYVFIGGLLLVISCFLMPHSKKSWISAIGCKPLNSLFHVGADVLNLLFL